MLAEPALPASSGPVVPARRPSSAPQARRSASHPCAPRRTWPRCALRTRSAPHPTRRCSALRAQRVPCVPPTRSKNWQCRHAPIQAERRAVILESRGCGCNSSRAQAPPEKTFGGFGAAPLTIENASRKSEGKAGFDPLSFSETFGIEWLREAQIKHGIVCMPGMPPEIRKLQKRAYVQSMQNIMAEGMFQPQDSPEQKAALARLETLLAMVEGWVEVVVIDAAGERLPTLPQLTEAMRRRRAAAPP